MTSDSRGTRVVAETENEMDGMASINLRASDDFPDPLGAARIMIHGPPVWATSLLNVFDLLANFLQFFLHSNHEVRHFSIVGLGPNGVDLSVHFLSEKIQFPPHRIA